MDPPPNLLVLLPSSENMSNLGTVTINACSDVTFCPRTSSGKKLKPIFDNITQLEGLTIILNRDLEKLVEFLANSPCHFEGFRGLTREAQASKVREIIKYAPKLSVWAMEISSGVTSVRFLKN